jgi:uncharacterized protein YggT (Ycf19 family)
MSTERHYVETHEPAEEVTTATSRVGPETAVDRTADMTYDPYAARRQAGERVVQVIYLLFGIIEGLILLRFVLKALGANPNAGFAEFIYQITAPLVAPFVGLFSNPTYGAAVIELQSIIALVVYALVAWVLGRLAWLLFGESRSAVKTTSSSTGTRT